MFFSEENYKGFACRGLLHSPCRENSELSNFHLRLLKFECLTFYTAFLSGQACKKFQGICVPSLYYEFPNLYPCKLLFPYLFCINNFQATFKEGIYGFCFYKFAEYEIVYIIFLILLGNILCHQVIQLVFIINFCVIVCSYCFKLYIFMIILYVSYRKKKKKG